MGGGNTARLEQLIIQWNVNVKRTKEIERYDLWNIAHTLDFATLDKTEDGKEVLYLKENTVIEWEQYSVSKTVSEDQMKVSFLDQPEKCWVILYKTHGNDRYFSHILRQRRVESTYRIE